jgi:hypothetical protein
VPSRPAWVKWPPSPAAPSSKLIEPSFASQPP